VGKKYVLYNLLAGNKNKSVNEKRLQGYYPGDTLEYIYLTPEFDYRGFVESLDNDDSIIVCGGDGTLNRFINAIEGIPLKNDLYFFGTGSGNDFLRDLGVEKQSAPILINEYMKNLPVATVNGVAYRFFNAIGYGLDGYCCQRSDELRARGKKKINYTSIALGGLLFRYKPSDATVWVDGEKYEFKSVYMAPTMFGKFFGGGAQPAPNQSRRNKEHKVSLAIIHNAPKLFLLRVFPTVFKGTHVRYKSIVKIMEGHEISVKFKSPCALQIDGEVILNVYGYTVNSRL